MTGDPELDAWEREKERQRLAMTHAPAPVAPAAPAAPVAFSAPPAALSVPRPPPASPPSAVDAGVPMPPPADAEPRVTVRSTQVSPEEKQIAAQRLAGTERAAGLAEEMGAVEAKAAQAKGEAAGQRAEVRAGFDKQRQEAKGDFDGQIKKASQEYAAIDGELKNWKLEDFFAKQSTAKKIGYAVAAMFGVLGQALQARAGMKASNGALDVIQGAIKDDMDQQRLAYDRKIAEGVRKKQDKAELFAQRTEVFRTIDLMEANALERAADLAEQKAASIGSEAAVLKGKQDAEQLRDKALSIRQQVAESKRVEITSVKGGGGPGGQGKGPTESQGKAESYLTSMLNEHRTLEQTPPLSENARKLLRQQMVLQSIYEKNPTADLLSQLAGINKSVQQKLSDDDRRAYAAASRFLDPIMRSRSGAVLSPAEAQRYVTDYFPTVGDKERDVADKRQARIAAMSGMARQTSNPQGFVQQIQGASSGGVAQARPEEKLLKNKTTGQMVRVRRGPDGQWYPVQ